jgi:hypothetical protein
MEINKREIYFFNILFPEALSIEIATQTKWVRTEAHWGNTKQKLEPNQCRRNQGFSSL